MCGVQRAKYEKAFGEIFAARKKRLRAASPYGRLESWDLISVIFKGGDDCRQENLAMQLIVLFDKVWAPCPAPSLPCDAGSHALLCAQ
jgi:phosphatidylinositol kinase/protein kinase (PI-3  family)